MNDNSLNVVCKSLNIYVVMRNENYNQKKDGVKIREV